MSGSQISLFKDFKSDELQSYIDKIQEIKNIDLSGFTDQEKLDFGVLQVEEYASVLSDLEPKQAALLLSTQGLSTAQIQQTLATQSLTKAEQYQAMLDAGLLKSKQKLTNVELQNNIAKTLSATMSEEEAAAKSNEMMASMGLAVVEEGENVQTVKLTKSKLAELVTNGQLTLAQAQEIAARTGVLLSMQAQNAVAPAWIANMKAMALATWDQVKATAAWMVSTPAGLITATIAGIAALTAVIWKLHDAFTVTLAEQKEKLKETKESWENVKTELQEVETELQNNIDKIKELEALSNLTWVEQEELNRLREVTKELKLQKQLKQDKQLKAAENLYKENKAAIDKEFGNAATDPSSIKELKQRLSSGDIGIINLGSELEANNINGLLASFQYIKEEKNKSTDAGQIKEYNEALDAITETIQQKISSLSEYKQNILDIASVRDLTEDEQATYDYLTSMQRMIYEFYSPATWNSLEFESIFDTEGLEKTKEELIAMAKAGKLSPEVLKSYPKLNNAIKESAIIAGEGSDAFREFYNQVMALAYPDALNYDEVRRQLFNASGIGDGKINSASDAKTYQKLESAGVLSNEGLEAYVSVRAKYDISDFNVDDLIYYIQKELNASSADIDIPAFNDIFTLKDADGSLNTLGQLNDQLNNIQTAYKICDN